MFFFIHYSVFPETANVFVFVFLLVCFLFSIPFAVWQQYLYIFGARATTDRASTVGLSYPSGKRSWVKMLTWQVPAGADKSEQQDHKWTGIPYCEAVVRKLLSKTSHVEDCRCIQAFLQCTVC